MRAAKAVLALVILAACGGNPAAPAPTPVPITGLVLNPSSGCGGYTAVPANATVIVKDADGRTLATTTLSSYADNYPIAGQPQGVCALRFQATVPPTTAYRFEIDRFSWTVQRSQIDQNGGKVTLPVQIFGGEPLAVAAA